MKRFMQFCGVILLVLLTGSCSSMHRESEEPLRKTIAVAKEIGRNLVEDDGDITAVSIAIMHEGKLIYSEGFGFRDIENGLSVDTTTQFNIGSVSKNFTAAAILLLAQEGFLHLDDRVSDLLDDFRLDDASYQDITIRMLLDHTSGMAGTNLNGGFSAQKNPLYTQQTLRQLTTSHLKHDPGALSVYCNDGFTVAQALIEQVSGMSFEQFLQEKIFTPLEMTHTSVGFKTGYENIANAYAQRSFRLPLEYVNIAASGGLSSTAEDLIKYATITFDPSLLHTQSLQEFLSDQEPSAHPDLGFNRNLTFGLGWDFTSYEPYQERGLQVLGKTGGTIQYTSILLTVPETRSAVAFIASGHCNSVSTTMPILDALLTESGTIAAEEAEVLNYEEFEILDSALASYAGYYGSKEALHRIDIDLTESVMHIFSHDSTQFIHSLRAKHRENGIFAADDGSYYALRTIAGTPSVVALSSSRKSAHILMSRLDDDFTAPSHGFTSSYYLPINFTANDLVLQLFSTDIIEELPQYLLLMSNGIVPYAIKDFGRTYMVLPGLRDQNPPLLLDDRHLQIAGYICIDATKIPTIENDVKVCTTEEATSVWLKIEGIKTVKIELMQGGRIIFLDSDFEILADTLYEPQPSIEMMVNDGYIACIADTPTEFSILVSN